MGRTRIALAEPTRGDRFQYKIDELFANNPSAKYYFLLAITLFLVFVGGYGYHMGAPESGSYAAAAWNSWKFVATQDDSPDESVSARAVSTVISFLGMVVFGILCGLIGETIQAKVEDLKKGKSSVLEEDHSVILGWSDKTLPIVEQLALANESDGGKAIVILAEMDKEEMDDIIAEAELELHGSYIVTRTGSAATISDIKKCSITKCRSVIILAAEGESADESDANAVRACMALSAFELTGHIVCELCDVDNVDVVRVGLDGSGIEMVPVVAHDIIGRLMIQCARQSGLAFVFSHIFQFDGNEIYIKEWPELVGRHFEQALMCVEDGILVGIRRAESMADGSHIMLNPEADAIIQEGDQIIVVAEDDDSYRLGPHKIVSVPPAEDLMQDEVLLPEKTLFIGWRRDLQDMLMELDCWLAPGSTVTLLSACSIADREEQLNQTRNSIEGSAKGYENMVLEHREGNAVLRADLLNLDMDQYDSLIILSDESWEGDGMSCDSRVLVTMLLCKDILNKLGRGSVPIVSEILDPRTKQLVALSGCSDYVVSSELVSMCIAQCSESRDMEYVLQSLFSEDGSEMHTKSVRFFADQGEELTFWQLQARAISLHVILLGYKQIEDEEFIINPEDKDKPICWVQGDFIACISED